MVPRHGRPPHFALASRFTKRSNWFFSWLKRSASTLMFRFARCSSTHSPAYLAFRTASSFIGFATTFPSTGESGAAQKEAGV